MPPMPKDRRRSELLDVYTKDVTSKDLTRVFTRDARDAYRAFTSRLDPADFEHLKGPKRVGAEIRAFLIAFGLKLSPARRLVFGVALILAVFGFVRHFSGIDVHSADHTQHVVGRGGWMLLGSIALLTLLVILEVADRLSLKNDLEIARGIQMAMLPSDAIAVPGVDVFGMSKPANTVGGDFYDIRPLANGRLLIAVGDVAGKGSPAALLMALFLAMERVLLDELTELVPLTTRLNSQIVRQAPGTRFITFFVGSYDPATGHLEYVNAGHPPALIRRADGEWVPLHVGGMALGLFERATYTLGSATLGPDDLFVAYSDGITEAEHPDRGYFEEARLQQSLADARHLPAADACRAVFADVRTFTDEGRLGDDLTILVMRRTLMPQA
ncbi:MAG: PP2C family protein-serine/threonine phosphatase [Acidobacteriota bacterium]